MTECCMSIPLTGNPLTPDAVQMCRLTHGRYAVNTL